MTTCLANSGGSVVKDLSANAETQETRDRSLGWEDPWSRKRQPTPVFLPGKFHGQRSLEGYSPWGLKRVGHDLVVKQQQQQQTCPLTLQSVRIQWWKPGKIPSLRELYSKGLITEHLYNTSVMWNTSQVLTHLFTKKTLKLYYLNFKVVSTIVPSRRGLKSLTQATCAFDLLFFFLILCQ